MLHIRLTRIGKKKQPEYRIIVCEKSRDPWGKALEILGHFNPRTNPPTITLKRERIEHWIKNGAQCSATMRNLLVDQGILQGEKSKTIKISDKRREALAKKQPKQEKTESPKKSAEVPAAAPEVKEEQTPANE